MRSDDTFPLDREAPRSAHGRATPPSPQDEDSAGDALLNDALRRAFADPDESEAPRFSGRYDRMEVIGRGGMGIVHRGRERRLEREIAIKTLRSELAGDPIMVKRFLREARILAALDHPAIVSVHELGTTMDGLPYMAMRLIRGESLEAVLSDRVDPDADRSRLLLAFQGICQAVAHAHEQGVLHRDLKPANVMIGPHGEVQVVDWGLASHLDAPGVGEATRPAGLPTGGLSGSESPLGTPAYMAPEQARAERSAVGFTTDVYGLGSILCEILTGAPPHGGTPLEALRSAASGESTEAFSRLRSASAPDELIALATRCLSPDPGERPADAGEVSRQFASCLARIDEATRQAQLDAVAGQTQATEERKRRRITLALSSVIVFLVLCGSAVWGLRERERAAHKEEVVDALDRALVAASTLRDEARQKATEDEGPWQRALDAARHALALSESEEVPQTWRRRAELEHKQIQRALRAATERGDRRRAAELATSYLAEARTLRLTDCSLRRCDAAYRTFLDDRGVDVENDTPAAVAAHVAAAQELGPLIVAALDEWCEVRAVSRATGSPAIETLTQLAAAADPAPWRNALRRHIGERNDDGVRQQLAQADPRTLEERSLALAALWIASLEQPEQARTWYTIAQLRFPKNPWVHHMAALDHLRHERPQEAVASWQAALAVKPEVPALWRGLASALVLTDPERSTQVSELAISKGMRCSKLWLELGRAQFALGAEVEAIANLEEAVRRARPRDAEALTHLGEVHARSGRPAAAEAAYRRAIERAPRDVRAHVGLAELSAAGSSTIELGRHLEAAMSCACRCIDPILEKRIARLSGAASPTKPGSSGEGGE